MKNTRLYASIAVVLLASGLAGWGVYQHRSPAPPTPPAPSPAPAPVNPTPAIGLTVSNVGGQIVISAALPAGTVQNIRAVATANPGEYQTQIAYQEGSALQLVDGPTFTVGGTVPPNPPAPSPPAPPTPPAPNPAPPASVALIEVGATYCGACQLSSGTIARLAKDGYKVSVVNVDQDATAQAKYKPEALPTWIMMAGDKELRRTTLPQSYETLKGWLTESQAFVEKYPP